MIHIEESAAAAGAAMNPATTRPVKLSVENVVKTFSGGQVRVPALSGVTLSVYPGEFVCLLGPSGCGKSTLLNIIAGLEKPESGTVRVDGVEVTEPGRDRMVMFQESALFPWLDVFGNVMFGLNLVPGLEKQERRRIATEHLELVGLSKFKHSFVHELSGGMRQRVALARSLAPSPKILLMDEPFAALDAMTREQLYSDLQRIGRERRHTTIFVTHNVREAVCLGDRVVVMAAHPGRIRAEFEIHIPRPREMNSPGLAARAQEIVETMKSEEQTSQALSGR